MSYRRVSRSQGQGVRPLALAGPVVLACLGLFCWLLVAAGTPRQAFADDLGVTVSPATQRMALTAGKTTRGSMMLANASGTATDRIRIYATPFYSSGNDYSTTDFAASNPHTALEGWLEFSQSEYVLKPHQQVTLHFKVDTPYDAAPGGQYAAIMAELVPANQKLSGSGAKTVRRVASLIYGQVAGPLDQVGAVTDQEIPSYLTQGPLTTSYLVNNSGNIDFNAAGHLGVTPILIGGSYDSGAATTSDGGAGSANVLPATSRTVDLSWQDPPIGLYNVTQTVIVLGKPATLTKLCLICPIWLVALIAAILVLIIVLIIILIIRHKRKKRERQAALRRVMLDVQGSSAAAALGGQAGGGAMPGGQGGYGVGGMGAAGAAGGATYGQPNVSPAPVNPLTGGSGATAGAAAGAPGATYAQPNPAAVPAATYGQPNANPAQVNPLTGGSAAAADNPAASAGATYSQPNVSPAPVNPLTGPTTTSFYQGDPRP